MPLNNRTGDDDYDDDALDQDRDRDKDGRNSIYSWTDEKGEEDLMEWGGRDALLSCPLSPFHGDKMQYSGHHTSHISQQWMTMNLYNSVFRHCHRLKH